MANLFFSKGMFGKCFLFLSKMLASISQVIMSCFWGLWSSPLESMKSKIMLMEGAEALKLNILSRLVNHLKMKY